MIAQKLGHTREEQSVKVILFAVSNKNIVALFQEIYKDRKKFSQQVFEVASSDLVNMGITVVSYTLKDIRDEEVNQFGESRIKVVNSDNLQKFVNLQYITLVCLDNGTNESSSKSLMFQVLFFFILFIDLGHSKLFFLFL